MLDQMIVKPVSPEQILWKDPKYLTFKLDSESEEKPYTILKGAENFLYKKLDIKPSTSLEVYKKSENIWNDLRDLQLSKLNNPGMPQHFTLDKENLLYLISDYNIVDIIECNSKEDVKEFNEKLDKYTIDITTIEKTKKFFTDGKNGLLKLICYDKNADLPNEEFTPIVIIEFNNMKSNYKVYTGILIYSSFTFIPSMSTYIECDSIATLINILNLDNALEYSKDNAEGLYDSYKTFSANPIEISVRELLSIMKKVGYKLELKDDSEVAPIANLQDESGNEKIQEFFNTFRFVTGESAYDVISLSEIKKIFRYNKLTLLEVLAILSKEYLTYDGSKINCDLLSSIVYNLYDKQNDKRQAESIKNEIAD